MTLATPGNDIFRGKNVFPEGFKTFIKILQTAFEKACMVLPKSMHGFTQKHARFYLKPQQAFPGSKLDYL
ncbi:hypothetical protein ASG01_13230 [Chryseobacterium sp. Leaf180]|uniref:hypothetical protein n=1 Tax=Chryseobacterium sp. Leaf180 TaxID=1736289 RepID=UPI000700916E|nr:hypothetical protein [Chryseobacterium sp. Leaf180]KQR91958.1 hypothetical protein ASG01_13230 [Chryseobacterium sp. Leaf180]